MPLAIEGVVTRRTIRISEQLDEAIQKAATARGFGNPSAFLRTGLETLVRESNANSDGGVEQRVAATLDRIGRDLFRISRAQQAHFAVTDTLIKTLLTCLPEPPPEAMAQAIARAKERYRRFVKSAGQNMVGDSMAAMRDLVTDDEG
jgi:Arc/MetJ-type ribon-helix-helix transcriptional regulator